MGLFGPWCSGPKALPDCRGPQHRRERTYTGSPHMKVERISTLFKCPLCSRYVRARLRANGCLQVSLTPKFVQRRRVVEVCSKYVSTLGRLRLPVWTLGALGPPRYASLGRTTSTGPRLSLSPYTSVSDFSSARQAQVGRKAFTFIKRHSLAPKGIWLGPRSQILDRIGQTDMMVYRGGSVPSGDAGHCSLQRRSRRDGKSVRTSISNN